MAVPRDQQVDASQFASQELHHGKKQDTSDCTLTLSGRTDDMQDKGQSDNCVSLGWGDGRLVADCIALCILEAWCYVLCHRVL